MIYSAVLDFYLGRAIWNTDSIKRKKTLLIISLAGNLGLLGFFKYADFAILQFNFLGEQLNLASEIPFLNLALPIGISFYTFQTISYTVDVYRGKLTPCKSLREFVLFVSFFPQLVAGPIVRASEFLPQLREKISKSAGNRLRLITIENANLKLGVTLMAFGFLKKMFFADNIAPFVDEIFNNPIGLESFAIFLGTIAFGIQIYGDFSGYSDIAIGAALILGFKLPLNFNKPYFAMSPSDFWKRWHISLSSWLRDYLYIPLGGNRKSNGHTYFNLMTVMFLGGLWHGASWNFVIWGVLHGAYLAVHKLISDRFPSLKNNLFFKSKIGKLISILITQYFIFLAWIPFRVHDFEDLTYSISKYILFDFQFSQSLQLIESNQIALGIMMLFIIFHYISFRSKNLVEKISKLNSFMLFFFLTIVFLLIFLFYQGYTDDFIYFKF